MSRDQSRESHVHRVPGSGNSQCKGPEAGQCLTSFRNTWKANWAWRAKGNEVREVDRLAADYIGPCNHGKDFKVPEGQ